MFFDQEDKVEKWYYTPANIEIILPNERIQLPNERLSSMEIINDYENNLFPIFKINLVLEPSRYYKIIKNKQKVKVLLRIQRYCQDNDSEEKSLMRDYINDTFDLILDDDDEDLNDNAKREEANSNFKNVIDSDENELRYVDNKVEFFLFKRNIVKGLRKNINFVFEDVTMTNVVKQILISAGIKKILMTPFHNNKKYDELIIPKMSCSKALSFVDSYYGLYKTGSLIYFGLERNYILQFSGKCTAWTKDEHEETCILVPMETSKHTTEPGVLKKDKKTDKLYIVGEYKTISIANRTESNDVLISNDIQAISDYTGESSTDLSGSNVSEGNSVRVITDKTENKWLANTYTKQTKMKGTVITIRLFDFIPGYLKPNKKISFVFEDPKLTKKYKGTYLLISISSSFIREGDYLRLSAVAVFEKEC